MIQGKMFQETFVLGISCDKNASMPSDPLQSLCAGPDAFIIFRQLYPG